MDRASYEQDFYGWALEQADALRRGEPSNLLDRVHIADEIEGLARSDRRACESFLEAICLHLLLLTYSTLSEPRKGWRREIIAFRKGLRRR